MSETETAIFESKTETEAEAKGGPDFVDMWLKALDKADDDEKDWRKAADEATEIYSGKKKTKFNILNSNLQTIEPALYNSTPAPDVRRRFNDPDPVAKDVADTLERCLAFSIDQYDFDAVIKSVTHDGELGGRGIAKVRYLPHFGPDGNVAYEEADCEYWPWKMYRRGPARTWADRPWEAFGSYMSKEDLKTLCNGATDKNGKELSEVVPLNYSSLDEKKENSEEKSIFKRALVWQIWDKDTRRVISICPDYGDAPLRIVPDPLGLEGFFSSPAPYQPVRDTSTLVPTVPYSLYEPLAQELNDVTERISCLVEQLRVRGGYGGEGTDIKKLAEADDGDLVPLTGIEALIQMGGIDKAVIWWPLDPITAALQQLIIQRDAIKQTIYEVTGISDILRGASDPNETLGAQQIKSQWGSLRIQDRQQEIQRFVRDIMELKADIVAKKFAPETIQMMTGIPLKPEVLALLKNDTVRRYRVDIESDSTIKGDLARNQQTMTNFLQGTAQFAQAMGPIVMQFPVMVQPAMAVYSSFCRQFKLGKQAEDALDGLVDMAAQAAQQAQQGPPQPPPDPVADAKAQQIQQDTQQKGQEQQAESQRNVQRFGMEQEKHGWERQKHEQDLKIKEKDLEAKQSEIGIKRKELGLKVAQHNQKLVDDATEQPEDSGFDPMQAMNKRDEDIATAIMGVASGLKEMGDLAQAMVKAVKVAAAPKEISNVIRGQGGQIVKATISPVAVN